MAPTPFRAVASPEQAAHPPLSKSPSGQDRKRTCQGTRLWASDEAARRAACAHIAPQSSEIFLCYAAAIRMLRSGQYLALALPVLVLCREARAENRFQREAEARNAKATTAYSEGRFESALQLYQSAHDLVPLPKYLYNIALAKEKTFDYEGCSLAFQKFQRLSDGKVAQDVLDRAAEGEQRCLERTEIPIQITSIPTNAGVYERTGDERSLRGRTPLLVPLRTGTHQFEVEFPGYVTQSQPIEVTAGSRPHVDFVLEKLSSLRIEIDPSGARVKIDESDWQAAPMTQEIRSGLHKVQVEKSGYESATREIRIEPGEQMSLVLSLRLLPPIRHLAVRSLQAIDGTVRVDNKLSMRLPSRTVLSPGPHNIQLAVRGYVPYSSELTIPSDRDVEITFDLEPKRSRASRNITVGLLAAGGAALITGTTYGILALVDESKFRRNPTPELSDRGDARARNADYWVGGALLLTASALVHHYFTRPGQSRASISYQSGGLR